MPKYVVRYGSMRQLGVMSSRPESLRRGDRIVARTPRGIELGEVLCEATDDALSHLDEPTSGQILRLLTEEDAQQAADQATQTDHIYDTCRQRIADEKLDMKLVDVEQVLGGDRIVVYYVSEDRVDFRNLVKVLATDLKTRVEMRQIGVRDEAKLLADYGDCGKPVCCNTHLSKMPPVSMKMAKLQKATLDPTKISGRCGRLKCCLRYEYDTYEAILKDLPPIGSEIVTREGKGRVLAQEILSEQLLIETEDMRRKMIHGSEVLSILQRGSNRQARSAGKRPPVDRGGEGGEKTGERTGERTSGRGDRPDRPQRPVRRDQARDSEARDDGVKNEEATAEGANEGSMPQVESQPRPRDPWEERRAKRARINPLEDTVVADWNEEQTDGPSSSLIERRELLESDDEAEDSELTSDGSGEETQEGSMDDRRRSRRRRGSRGRGRQRSDRDSNSPASESGDSTEARGSTESSGEPESRLPGSDEDSGSQGSGD